MKLVKTFFNGSVKVIQVNIINDDRGFFFENYNYKKLLDLDIKDNFVQDNFSFSKTYGIVRGLHFQEPNFSQSKLVSVLQGEILDVFVDLRINSPTYGKHEKVILNDKNALRVYIPVGFAHGFSVKKINTLVSYKTNNFYSSNHEKTICYDDLDLDINWDLNIHKVQTSTKDKRGIKFKNYNSVFYL